MLVEEVEEEACGPAPATGFCVETEKVTVGVEVVDVAVEDFGKVEDSAFASFNFMLTASGARNGYTRQLGDERRVRNWGKHKDDHYTVTSHCIGKGV